MSQVEVSQILGEPATVWRRFFLVAGFVCGCVNFLAADETALDRYVAKPDPTYSWHVVKKTEGGGATQFVVDLKSQTWRSPKEVNRTVWQHWLTIVKPANCDSKTAFLFITGGSNGDGPPKKSELGMIAGLTNSVVAELKMVPNEPLVFDHDGVQRKEDDLIAYTWDKFLKGGDDFWPARLPMVQKRRACDGLRARTARQPARGKPQDREIPGRRRVEARLDHLVHGGGR